MDMRKYSGSSFLKVEDVRATSRRERIANVTEGQYGKPDVVFESGDKLSINKTNNRILVNAFGTESADWVGGDVELRLGDVEVNGELRETIVVVPVSPRPAGGPSLDDDIPLR